MEHLQQLLDVDVDIDSSTTAHNALSQVRSALQTILLAIAHSASLSSGSGPVMPDAALQRRLVAARSIGNVLHAGRLIAGIT